MTAAFLLETIVLAVFAAALLPLFPLPAPKLRLAYWQAVLALFFLVPVVQSFLVPAVQAGAVYRFTSVALGATQAHSANWLRPLLITGAALRGLWLAAGLIRLQSLRSRSLPLQGNLFLSPGLTGAVSFGIVRPVILVGRWWSALAPEIRRAILVHEQIHIQRRDWLLHLLEEAIETVLWFNPAVWFVISRIRLAREESVDAETVSRTLDSDSYIRALLSCVSPPIHLSAPAFASRNSLAQRISTLKKEYVMSKRKAVLSCGGLAIFLLAGSTAIVWSFPLQSSQSDAPGKVYKVDEITAAPAVIYKRDPSYTPEAKQERIQGTVILSTDILADGSAANVQVIKSLDPGLDREAAAALAEWRFRPGTKDNQPVAVRATIEMNFRLK